MEKSGQFQEFCVMCSSFGSRRSETAVFQKFITMNSSHIQSDNLKIVFDLKMLKFLNVEFHKFYIRIQFIL